MESPTDSCHFFCTPGNPCATPIVIRGEGSFSYQGVSTRGARHSPVWDPQTLQNKAKHEMTNRPVLPHSRFFRFPRFFRFAVFLAFLCVFALFSKGFKGSAGRKIHAFFGGSSLFFPNKKQGLEGQGRVRLCRKPKLRLRDHERHINIWHINDFSVTPVTDPPGRVPERNCLCLLGSAHST